MKIIAVASEKGGSGKTTSTINIAARLNELGYRVLMVDLDPQGDLTTHAGYRPNELDVTISVLFSMYIRRQLHELDDMIPQSLISIREGLTLLPADVLMEEIDTALVSAVSREYVLKKILGKVTQLAPYDYVLIDCRPTLSILTVNALTACDYVVIPIKAQFLDFVAFNLLYNNIELLREETNPAIRILGVFMTMFDSSTNLSVEAFDAVKKLTPPEVPVCNTVISQAVALAEASARGQDIFTYVTAGKSAERRKAVKPATEYATLVDELLANEKGMR